MFQIDNEGRIKTAKGLDRENKSTYELTVRAEDRGGTNFLQSLVTISQMIKNFRAIITNSKKLEYISSA